MVPVAVAQFSHSLMYRVSSLELVDTLSAVVLNFTVLCLGCGAIVPLAATALIALVCAVALSTCFEAIFFALFARPYDLGDVIVLVSSPLWSHLGR